LSKRISGRVSVNETIIFLSDEVLSSKVEDSHSGWKGGGIRQKSNLVQNLAQKRNPIKKPSQRGFDGGCEILSRCIAFGIPIANSYTPSNNITSKQENLIMTSLRP
jgi:hypothetical protein